MVYNINGQEISVGGGIAANTSPNIYDINVKSVAHKGIYNPKNSLVGFKKARENNWYYVECDIRKTLDNVVVLGHDDTLTLYTTGESPTAVSVTISETAYDDLISYDYRTSASDANAGNKIPTFEQFVELCRNAGLYPYIDMKVSFTQTEINSLMAILKNYSMENKCSWLCTINQFDLICNAYPKSRIGFLDSGGSVAVANAVTPLLACRAKGCSVFFDIANANINDTTINLCKNNDIPLEVWTINSASAVLSMNPYITGITSDGVVAGKVLLDGE